MSRGLDFTRQPHVALDLTGLFFGAHRQAWGPDRCIFAPKTRVDQIQYNARRHNPDVPTAKLSSLLELGIDVRFPKLRAKEKNVRKLNCFIVNFMSTSVMNEPNDSFNWSQ